MRREFSAGGVARPAHARPLVARRDPARGQARRRLGAAEGPRSTRARRRAETALREVAEETGLQGRLDREARRRRGTSTLGRASAIFKIVSFYLSAAGRPDRRRPPEMAHRGRRGALAAARGGAARCSRTGASARWPRKRSLALARSDGRMIARGRGRCSRSTSTRRSSPTSCARTARRRRSGSATSRAKYQKGMIVTVLVGVRYGPAREDLRRGDRQGRGEAARRALAARDRARQPGDPPAGRDGAASSASSTTARSPRRTRSP